MYHVTAVGVSLSAIQPSGFFVTVLSEYNDDHKPGRQKYPIGRFSRAVLDVTVVSFGSQHGPL